LKAFQEPRNRSAFDLAFVARLLRIAESIHWNRFLGSIKVYKFWLCIATSLSAFQREAKKRRGKIVFAFTI
jgi:hypothetical protein